MNNQLNDTEIKLSDHDVNLLVLLHTVRTAVEAGRVGGLKISYATKPISDHRIVASFTAAEDEEEAQHIELASVDTLNPACEDNMRFIAGKYVDPFADLDFELPDLEEKVDRKV